jgi:hypothetical protein
MWALPSGWLLRDIDPLAPATLVSTPALIEFHWPAPAAAWPPLTVPYSPMVCAWRAGGTKSIKPKVASAPRINPNLRVMAFLLTVRASISPLARILLAPARFGALRACADFPARAGYFAADFSLASPASS